MDALDGPAFTQSAGLVLLTPFLPRLFERMELTSDGDFKGGEQLNQALDLLHYAIFAEQEPNDPGRPLEKLLCGVANRKPVRRELPLGEAGRELVEDMLGVVIRQWPALGSTSVDGLRETFLRREGRLEPAEDHVHLKVATKAYDMLLDSVPWSYGLVKFPWMKRALHVEWR